MGIEELRDHQKVKKVEGEEGWIDLGYVDGTPEFTVLQVNLWGDYLVSKEAMADILQYATDVVCHMHPVATRRLAEPTWPETRHEQARMTEGSWVVLALAGIDATGRDTEMPYLSRDAVEWRSSDESIARIQETRDYGRAVVECLRPGQVTIFADAREPILEGYPKSLSVDLLVSGPLQIVSLT